RHEHYIYSDLSHTRTTPHHAVTHLPLHDALPIYRGTQLASGQSGHAEYLADQHELLGLVEGSNPARQSGPATVPDPSLTRRCVGDRKSTRLNSSHEWISYAVFCLKKKTRIHDRSS